jgi:4-hydroxybenzoyl-CoA thioesterase
MFVTPYHVRFADVDNAGIFYYPRFFHAFHVAFEQWWMNGVGRPYHLVLNEDKVGFPAVHIECDFKKPIGFGDPMEIRIGVTKLGHRSVVFRYEFAHRDSGEVHAAADITKAIVDMESWRPIAPPDHLREAIEGILIG